MKKNNQKVMKKSLKQKNKNQNWKKHDCNEKHNHLEWIEKKQRNFV